MITLTFAVIIVVIGLAILFRFSLFKSFRAPRIKRMDNPSKHSLAYSEERIETLRDRYLSAWYLPTDNSAACIVMMHGWGSSAELMLPIAEPFVRAGYNVLLPDARCHGNSDDDRFQSLPRFAEDIEACIKWLIDEGDRWNGQLVLLGHSVGAGACILTTSRSAKVDALISVSAFSHPQKMMQRYLANKPFPDFLRSLIIKQVQNVIGFRFDDIAPQNTIKKVRCPTLIAHGKSDSTVPFHEAMEIADAATCEHQLLLIDGANHDSVEVFRRHSRTLITFLSQHGIQRAQ